MRPAWCPDAYVARVARGALVRGPAGESWVDGRHAHALLRWLAPRLDGRATLAEVLSGLDPEQAPAVERLVEHLVASGMVVDADAAADGAEPPAVVAARARAGPPLGLEGWGGLHDAVSAAAGTGAPRWSWRRPGPRGGLVLSVRDAADPRAGPRPHHALARPRAAR